MNPPSPLLQALQRTLRSVSEAQSLDPNNEFLNEFKRTLIRMIAELEMREQDVAQSDAA